MHFLLAMVVIWGVAGVIVLATILL